MSGTLRVRHSSIATQASIRVIPPTWHPAVWIAVLRIAIGLYFLKALWTKMDVVLLGGVIPFLQVDERWLSVMPQIVAQQAAENPLAWYKAFLGQLVLPHSALFAHLTAWGETLVGISLTLGLLSGCGAIGALLLSLSYGLASQQHFSIPSFVFRYLVVMLMPLLFLARSGLFFGLDAWIARRWDRSRLVSRPWS
jgi:uncharacterized membrane protein YphA (DoxX/SURF4 family)